MPEHTQVIGTFALWKTVFARAVDCSIEQQSTARLFGSRSCRMVPVNHPAQMNSNPNCRSFASGIRCPAGCHSSLGNASCVPALKPCILSNGMRCFSAADRPDRHRSAVAEHSHIECNCSACADTAHYANDSFACCVFVRKRRAEHRIQCVFPLGEGALPLHGAYILAPANMGFCGHLRACRRTRYVT